MDKPTDLQLAWEFVGDYYPDYSRSQEISDSDLLQRVVDLEFDPEDEDDSANQLYKEIGEEFTDDEGTILRIAEERITKLNAEIYERAIVEYMKLKQDKEQESTYYLFGVEQCNAYMEGIDVLLSWAEKNFDNIITFEFIEGVTPSWELAEAMYGWNEYAVLSDEDFKIINELKNL